MRLLKASENKVDFLIDEIANTIRSGGILIYPTDTVYGIGCRIDSSKVADVIFIKRRTLDKPLSVAFADMKMLEEYTTLTNSQKETIRGKEGEPYTFIVRKKNIPDIVTGGLATVGVRILNHNLMRAALTRAGTPILSTSANLSGQAPQRKVAEISQQIIKSVDLVVDNGECKIGSPSTIVDLATGKILR